MSEEIKMFIEKGYARASATLLYRLRNNPIGIEIRFFDPKAGNSKSLGSIKYSSRDILGDVYSYYFDTERTENFINFLVGKFYEKNQNPDIGLKKAFTRLLHSHRLHWSEEYTGKKKKNLKQDKKNKR